VGEEDREEGDGGGEVEPEGERGREREGTTRRRRKRRRWGRRRRLSFTGRRSGNGGGWIGLRHCCWLGLLAGMGEWSEQWESCPLAWKKRVFRGAFALWTAC
jgi:hypothetical protein